MVFSSFVFLLVFLPLVLFLYYISPGRLKNFVLLIASLLFYAWGEPVYVLIMLFSTVFDYTNGRLIEYFKKRGSSGKAKAALIVDICGNLGILGFFKYADFFIGNFNSITGAGISLLHIALPIGISFYTFQTMSYTIDVYRGEVKAQHNILDFATYVTLFPQLIAGPIVQYKTVADELSVRKVGLTDFSEGAFRFSVGLAKKVLFANQIGRLWDEISGLNELTAATAWLGAIAYTFQIYYDFSGYSDMAIGLGRMFGFHFLENFNFPYISGSITEFWRRWHISLSSWFREYVYIPLGGNRKGLPRQILNLFIVWCLTGLWHGANWNFVIWGLYYGLLLILEKLFLLKLLKKLPVFAGHIYTLFFVIVGWAVFAQTDMGALARYLKAMFGIGVQAVNADFFYFLSCNAVLLLVLILCAIDFRSFKKRPKRGDTAALAERPAGSIYEAVQSARGLTYVKPVFMLLFLVLSFAFLVGDSYNPFLYFRF
ncbi:MAG: MBOAT family protein [Muribaculaceae bacterium]|nr:MBOAT family protein [Roseburia sp.]MCM1429948.1 MBOAT family protein [Muribaculaceae bacterium]MCM1493025.1 MBOAT family protein [Muribaculaceae bacterium]